MNVWMISTKADFTQHSISRFSEEAEKANITLQVFKPGELTFFLDDQKAAVCRNGAELVCPEVLLVRTGASTITYHTLALMKFFELHTVTQVINSFPTYAKTKDKFLTYLHLAAHDVPVPNTQLLSENVDLNAVKEQFSFPVVVKEISGARGNSVVFCNSPTELEELLQLLFTVRKQNTEFLIQEYIHTSARRDVRVYVVGDRILGAIERRAGPDRRKANVSLGGEVRPFEVTGEISEMVRKAKETLHLEMGGIDLLCCEEGFKVCEANLSAQFVGFEKATGINVPEQILSYCLSKVQLPRGERVCARREELGPALFP